MLKSYSNKLVILSGFFSFEKVIPISEVLNLRKTKSKKKYTISLRDYDIQH